MQYFENPSASTQNPAQYSADVVSAEGTFFEPVLEGLLQSSNPCEVSDIASSSRQVLSSAHKVYNFEVARTHTYIADDVRVHNRSVLYALDHENERLTDIDLENNTYSADLVSGNGSVVVTGRTVDAKGNTSTVDRSYTLGENGDVFLEQTNTYAFNDDGTETLIESRVTSINTPSGRIGESAGESLSPFLASLVPTNGGVLQELLVGTALATILGNAGEFLGNVFDHRFRDSLAEVAEDTTTSVLDDIATLSLEDFGVDFIENGISIGTGLVSQLIAAEIFGSLQSDDFSNQLLQGITELGVQELLGLGLGALNEALSLGLELPAGGLNLASIAGLLVSAILDQIVTFETTAAQIAEAATAAVVSIVAYAAGFTGPIGVIAAAAAFVVGGIVELIFDKDPRAIWETSYDEERGEFVSELVVLNDGGDPEIGRPSADAYVEIMNFLVEATASRSHNFDEFVRRFGHDEELYIFGESQNGGGPLAAYLNSGPIIQSAVNDIADFDVVDGDLKVSEFLKHFDNFVSLHNILPSLNGYRIGISNIGFKLTDAGIYFEGESFYDALLDVDASFFVAPNAGQFSHATSGFYNRLIDYIEVNNLQSKSAVDVARFAIEAEIKYYRKYDNFYLENQDLVIEYNSYLGNFDNFDEFRALSYAYFWHQLIPGESVFFDILYPDYADYEGLIDVATRFDQAHRAFRGEHGQPSIGSGFINDVISQLEVVKDYQFYLENSAVINELISLTSGDEDAPGTAEAAGWLATLFAAEELGLNRSYTAVGDDIDNVFYTADGADTIDGAGGDDEIRTYGGNDVLIGGAGRDTLLAGSMNDTLIGGTGADVLDGGTGLDTASYSDADARVVIDLSGAFSHAGDAFGDTFISIERYQGSSYDDVLRGDGASNTFIGADGEDRLLGFDGRDYLYGGNEDDDLHGHSGDDVLEGGAGSDTINGGDGTDTASFRGALAAVRVDLRGIVAAHGDALGDTVVSIENLDGSAFADALRGDDHANKLLGLAGDDYLSGFGGDDLLYGDTGDDRIYGNNADDRLFGGDGIDSLFGGNHDDRLLGGAGGDVLDGGAGVDFASYFSAAEGVIVDLRGVLSSTGEAQGDTLISIENLIGSAHNDGLRGDDSANSLFGGDGIDNLYGYAGADLLNGGDGNDRLFGNLDDDRLIGGLGGDTLDGGGGSDLMIYQDIQDTRFGEGNRDLIVNFDVEADRFSFSAIDTDLDLDGDQGFVFVEGVGGAFSGTSAELAFYWNFESEDDVLTILRGDSDGDGNADFQIAIEGQHDLSESNFVL